MSEVSDCPNCSSSNLLINIWGLPSEDAAAGDGSALGYLIHFVRAAHKMVEAAGIEIRL